MIDNNNKPNLNDQSSSGEETTPKKSESAKDELPIGISIGLCIGVALGVVFNNIGIGTALGVCLGAYLGHLIKKRNN